jgi:hypothetical protein
MISSQIANLYGWLLIVLIGLRGLAALIRLSTTAHRALRYWRANRRH